MLVSPVDTEHSCGFRMQKYKSPLKFKHMETQHDVSNRHTNSKSFWLSGEGYMNTNDTLIHYPQFWGYVLKYFTTDNER
jgi:hypothetical protein